MTTITRSSKKQEPEKKTILLTTLLINKKKNYPATSTRIIKSPRSLAQISAESVNPEGNKYYRESFPRQVGIGSSIYASKLKDIHEEKVREPSYEIAVYKVTQPIEYQNNLLKSDVKERRSKFFSLPINDLSNNLPRLQKKIEIRNHQRQRAQRLRLYLDSLKSEVKEEIDAGFTEGVLNLSWFVWEALKSFFEETGLCLEVPDACPGLRDNFMYTWSKSEHYLECEIFGSGEIEFFYRNRNTGEVWGEDTTLEQGFSANILNKGSFFSE